MYQRPRHLTALVALGIVSIVALACSSQQGVPTKTESVSVQQQGIPSASSPVAPNPLAKDYATRLGVTVSALKAPTGKVLLDPKAGDLYFFSNSSTTWGATQTKNSVWIIDAKTKQTVLEVAPADGEDNSSHGIAVSGDGRYVYLPMIGKDNRIDVLDGRTFEVVQTIRTISRRTTRSCGTTRTRTRTSSSARTSTRAAGRASTSSTRATGTRSSAVCRAATSRATPTCRRARRTESSSW